MNKLQVGDVFAKKYKLEERLGEGTSKEAWKAMHLLMNRTATFKVFKEKNLKIEKILKDEATHHAKIGKHPHVVDIYDVGVDPETGLWFYVEEFVQGTSLEQKISTEKLSEKQLLTIISQLTDTLSHIHKKGIIYRDLKPGNILIEENNKKINIKLTDFGGSTKPGKKEIPFISADGTILLRAIDTFEKYSDPTVDMYSLGIMLYKMITGHYPYEGDNAEEIKYKMQTTTPKRPRQHDNVQISSWLEKTIMNLLNKNPKKRPTAKQLQRNIWLHKHWTKVMLGGMCTAGITGTILMNILYPAKKPEYNIAYLSNKTLIAQNIDDPNWIKWPKNISARASAFAFDRDKCFFATTNKDIFSHNIQTAEKIQITRTPDQEETDIQVSPSGLTVAYMIGRDLYVSGRRGSKELERKILEKIDEYTWYTMKDQITYRKGKEIFITEPQEHPFAEKNAKKIADGTCPRWNSFGTALFYRTMIDQHNSITFKIFWHSDNIGIKEPLEGAGYKISDDTETFELSRDQSCIVYYTKKEKSLIILDLDKKINRQIPIEELENIQKIQIHPETNQILFQAKIKGEQDHEIFVYDIIPGKLKQITNNDHDDINPIYLTRISLR